MVVSTSAATGNHTLACPNENSQTTADLAYLRTAICRGVACIKRLHGASPTLPTRISWKARGARPTCTMRPGPSWRQVLVMQQSTERWRRGSSEKYLGYTVFCPTFNRHPYSAGLVYTHAKWQMSQSVLLQTRPTRRLVAVSIPRYYYT